MSCSSRRQGAWPRTYAAAAPCGLFETGECHCQHQKRQSLVNVLVFISLFLLQKGQLASEEKAAIRAEISCLAVQLEAADQTTLTSMASFDDDTPLNEIQPPDKPVCLPLDSHGRRQAAHAYRLIRHKYSQGQGQSCCPANVLHSLQALWPEPAMSDCLRLVACSPTQAQTPKGI